MVVDQARFSVVVVFCLALLPWARSSTVRISRCANGRVGRFIWLGMWMKPPPERCSGSEFPMQMWMILHFSDICVKNWKILTLPQIPKQLLVLGAAAAFPAIDYAIASPWLKIFNMTRRIWSRPPLYDFIYLLRWICWNLWLVQTS